jgi:hypothetical protein
MERDKYMRISLDIVNVQWFLKLPDGSDNHIGKRYEFIAAKTTTGLG